MTRELGPWRRRFGSDPVWRLPALWMTFALLAVGLVLIGADHTFAVHLPLALAATIVLFAGHGVLVFLLVRGLDLPAPRPLLLLGVAVAWGGLVAAGLTSLANRQPDEILVVRRLAAAVGGAAAACAVVDPDLVVLGGPVGTHPGLLAPVRAAVATAALAPVRVEPGAVTEFAPLRGALTAALDAGRATLSSLPAAT
jgi:hypothetical protein